MDERLEDAGLTEARGSWILPVGDGRVTQLQFDHALTLVVESWIVFRIEAAFSYGPDGAATQFEPSDTVSMAPLLSLHQATVTSAQIRKDGRLTLSFADGGRLTVLPDERYEAFTVSGSLPPVVTRRGFTFVARPGGGLSRFGP